MGVSLPELRDCVKVQQSFPVWTAYCCNRAGELNVLVGAASFGRYVLVFCFVVLSLPGFERGSSQTGGKKKSFSH